MNAPAPPVPWTRRSYQAQVLLVPLEGRSHAALRSQPTTALDGISCADPTFGGSHSDADQRVKQAVEQADMLVLLVHDLGEADLDLVTVVATAAHNSGKLLAAIIVNPTLRWHDEASLRAAAHLREAVDTVVVLRDLTSATAFLQTLRGGTRERE
jgi:hypothetical protein